MRHILFLFMVFVSSTIVAQTQKQLWIKVVDGLTEMPLPRATIILDNGRALFTNEDGVLQCSITLPVKINVSYISYKSQSTLLKRLKSDSLTFRLIIAEQSLPEVFIASSRPKFAVFERQDSELLDFELWGNYILLGVHDYNKRKCSLVIMDSTRMILDEYSLPADFEYFYKSCIQKYYAVATSGVFEIQFKKGVLFLKSINPQFFYDKVLFYKGFYGKYFYIMEPRMDNQLHTYYIEDTEKRKLLPFSMVANTKQFHKYTQDLEQKKKIREKEIYILEGMTVVSNRSYNNEDNVVDYYTKETKGEFVKRSSMFFEYTNKSVKSQLFVRDSVVCIFDLENLVMEKYLYDGTFIDTLKVAFQKPNNMQLSNDGYIISNLEENGTTVLDFLDINTISFNRKYKLKTASVLKWIVKDGFVFYLTKKTDSFQNSFLVMEPIK